MSHSCRALVIHCIDFRLQKSLKNFLEEKGLLGTIDVVSTAGAIMDLARNEHPEDTTLFKQIQISSKLHNIQEVYLINHTDCGAYGGKSAFADEATELQTHTDDLQKAAAVIKQHFPQLQTHILVAKISEHETGHMVDIVSAMA